MRNVYIRLFFGLVLIAAIVGVGLLAYNAGISRGETLAAAAPAGQAANPAVPTYPVPYFWRPFPFFGFGFFGLLALFILLSIAFRATRWMIWGPRWGWRRWHHGYGYWGERGQGEEPPIPPMMSEMHRRMHEADQKNTGDQAAQK